VAVVGDVGRALLARVSRAPLQNPAELAPEMALTAATTGFGQLVDVFSSAIVLCQLLALDFPLLLPPSTRPGAPSRTSLRSSRSWSTAGAPTPGSVRRSAKFWI
jgi:hypothetical protein